MSENSSFKFACPRCGGRIEAPPGYAGLSIPCPHCGQTIQVSPPDLAAGRPGAGVDGVRAHSRKLACLMVGANAAAGLLLAGVAFWSAHRSFRPVSTDPKPDVRTQPTPKETPDPSPPSKPPKAADDLKTGGITLDRQPKSSLVYATGAVTNDSDYQRFGVRIELEALDRAERKVGAASDYIQVLEPRKIWVFRALVTDPKAASARVAGISEEP